MPRINSSNWSVNDQITAARLQDFNEELDDIYTYGNDRGRVRTAISGTALKIDIAAFAYRVGSNSGLYAGGTDISVTNTATNYVMINDAGTIVINTSGFVTENARLATVVCSGGVVTSISIYKPDVVGGSFLVFDGVTSTTMSGNATLTTASDAYQLFAPNGANRDVTLDTSGVNEGDFFWIKHSSTTYELTIKQGGSPITTLRGGDMGYFTFDGTDWQMMMTNNTYNSKVLFANTTDASDITGTTSETLFDQNYTIPANTLKVGDVIEIYAAGGGGTGGSNKTFKIKCGSSVLFTTGAGAIGGDGWTIIGSIVVRAIGASGSFRTTGFLESNSGTTAKLFNNNTTITVDTTTTNSLGISGQLASSGDSMQMATLIIRKN